MLVALVVFGTSYLVRPLGAVLFGYLGDRRGRRGRGFALLDSVTCMGVGSTLMGLLSHAQVGVWVGVFMVTLRFVQGVSPRGGEVRGAATIIAENSLPNKRAL